MVKEGMEIWAHSCTHRDPQGTDARSLSDEIKVSRTELEAQGLVVQGWTQPGTSGTTPEGLLPYGADLTKFSGFDSAAGRLIMETYPIGEADAPGRYRALPTGPAFGFGHLTIETMTLTQLRTALRYVVKHKVGAEFMCHAGLIGTATYLSVADLTTWLAEVAAARDAGTVEVLTQSGLYYANPGSSTRLDLVSDGSFTGLVVGGDTGQWTSGNWAGVTISDSGGVGSGGYVRIAAPSSELIHNFLEVTSLDLGGAVFEAGGWARAPGADVTARLRVIDNLNAAALSVSKSQTIHNADGWVHIRQLFAMPTTTTEYSTRVGQTSSGTADWSGVYCRRL
jgi:hypothetical protein